MAGKTQSNKRESGQPGGGAGRKDEVGGSRVYPMSGPHPPGDAPIVSQAGWGQGERGAAGYNDHGESELTITAVAPEKCRDIMTKNPAYCLRFDSTAKAAQLMMEHDTGIVPVVTSRQDKYLVGVVTDRDLALTVVADSADPNRTSVESVMSSPPVICSPDDPYEKAIEIMERHKIRRVLVVDESGRLVGVVSQADIALRVPGKNAAAQVVEQISQPDS